MKMYLNEIYSTVQICKHLSDMFPVKNGLKQDALLPLLFNFAFEYAIRRVQGKTGGLLVYADINTLGRHIHTIKQNTEASEVTSNEIPPEVNAKKIKYMPPTIGNKSFERVKNFKYLGNLTNQFHS
jgi:hypothetical protein